VTAFILYAYARRMPRRVLLIVALSAALVGGCTSLAGCTSSSTTWKPRPSSAAAEASPSAAGTSYGTWDAGRSTPTADKIYPKYGNAAVDVLHYGLELTWAPDTKTLTGRATIQLRAAADLTAIMLDFAGSYAIETMTLDGAAATGSVTDGKLSVPASLAKEKDATLVVKYHGTPATVPMPSHRSDVEPLGLTVTDDGSLWTMQEPYGASTWYPANDQPSDKALYDIAVTVPAGWAGVASGTPQGQDGNTYRYTSSDPVAAYLTTLAIGKYQKETASGPHGVPITYWFRPGVDDSVMKVVRRSPTYLDWLEKKFGPYPFPSAGVVVVPSKSAMETQQMVTLGDKITAKSTDDINALDADLLHEYSHHWFGDAVTPSSWLDLWLNEGFAEYAQALYTNERDNVSAARWEQWARTADASLRSRLGPPGSPRADSFAESNVYVCPALMLHQIHKQLGDGAFFALARDWAQQHRGTVQNRSTFIAFVNQHTGKNLTALINTWLDSPTTPK
jgi:aminopeptidase N